MLKSHMPVEADNRSIAEGQNERFLAAEGRSAKPATTAHYDSNFFGQHELGSRRSAGCILPLVFDFVHPGSVLDVGCGIGTWLAVTREKGIEDYLGVDGDYVDRSQLQIPANRFVARDLLQALDLGRTFDLVMSLEVGEHLDSSTANTFVESLVRHGQVILFSAAIPGQPGTNHVNPQWPAYWAEKFLKHNYLALDCLRNRIWDDEKIDYWYRQNVIVYVHEERFNLLTRLSEERLPRVQVPMHLVHPELFTEQPTVGAAAKDLARAIRKNIRVRAKKLTFWGAGKKRNPKT
jgi:SAM-dependent methyltransferase